MIKYFSIFTGIGGFEVGMHNSKYKDELKCIGFSEVNENAISIYNRHFPRHRNFGDATRINAEELEDFSLFVGGFPCQAFSITGSRKGFNDCRGTLFFEIARILAVKQPRYFLFENVKGLLSHNCGKTFQRILTVFDELGYDVSWQIYNSCQYGVPQHRERVYLKGYFRRECGCEIFDVEETITTSEERNEQLEQDKNMSDDFMIRKLTPIECERLQGFEDGYTKYGVNGELISDSQRYKLLGNAVTTNVVKHIFNNWNLSD